MAILQSGVPKSGNYWLYKILTSIFKHAGKPNKRFIQNYPIHKVAKDWELSFAGQSDMDFLTIGSQNCYFRISSVFKERIIDIDDYINQCSLVWTHSPVNSLALKLLPKFDKVVYIIRDPRDVAISYSKFAFTPHKLKNSPPHYEINPETYLKNRLDEMIRYWVYHVGSYLKYKDQLNIYPVFYERLLHSFDSELPALLNYLEIDLDSSTIAQIKHEVSFATLKQQSPNHLRKGTSRQWQYAMTPKQKVQVAQAINQMLKLLNYPVDESEENLPSLPAYIDCQQLEQAIASSHLTWDEEVKRLYTFLTNERSLTAKMSLSHQWFVKKIENIF